MQDESYDEKPRLPSQRRLTSEKQNDKKDSSSS